MPTFMLLYKGEATDPTDMPPDQAQAIMEQWGAWMGGVGSAMVDMGSPFGPSASVVDDGSSGTATTLSGYSIVTADDMAAARALVDGHPYLSEGSGNFAIDCYELLPMPDMG
ncbi:MAG TPA: YciI family protein [Euzebya sp.]|nr:YciI family protein [Euzebya sp.]